MCVYVCVCVCVCLCLCLCVCVRVWQAADAGCPIGFAPEARDNFARTYTPGMPGFTIQTVPNGHNSGRLFVFR